MNLNDNRLNLAPLTQHAPHHLSMRYRVPLRETNPAGVMVNLGILPNTIVPYNTIDHGDPASCKESTLNRLKRMLAESYGEVDACTSIHVPERPIEFNMAALGLAAAKSGNKRIAAQAGRSRDELLASAAKLRFFIIVMEQKGGVGKSVGTMVGYETLKIYAGKNIHLIDADNVNRNLSRAGLTKAGDALNASRIDFEGFLFEAAERVISGEVDGVIIDSAAGGEAYFRPQLAELAKTLRASEANVRLVIVRPLTLSPLVHDNVCEFGAKFMNPDMGVLLLRNMGQGRSLEDYAEFDDSPEYRTMNDLGMAECILESAGAKYSDMVTGFNRTFADIALNEPDDLGLVGRQLDIARRVFTRPVRLFLARWLYRQTTALQAGLIEAAIRTL